MFVSDVLSRLSESGGAAAALDSPVLMAALLRRCRDVAVDDRTGMAAIVAPGPATRVMGSRPRMPALPPPVPGRDGEHPH